MRLDIDSATDIAINYAKKSGYTWIQVESAKFVSEKWIVKIDVGVITKEIKTITIDDISGKVTGYE